jgi:hypothetical protein
MKKGLLLSVIFGVMMCSQLVYAQTPQVLPSGKGGLTSIIPCTINNGDPGDLPKEYGPTGLNCNSWNDLLEVINFLIGSAMKLAILLATVSFAYAGWLYLTSNGDMGKVKSAHDIFLKVLKGFIFMGLAYLIVKFILTAIADPSYSKLQ